MQQSRCTNLLVIAHWVSYFHNSMTILPPAYGTQSKERKTIYPSDRYGTYTQFDIINKNKRTIIGIRITTQFSALDSVLEDKRNKEELIFSPSAGWLVDCTSIQPASTCLFWPYMYHSYSSDHHKKEKLVTFFFFGVPQSYTCISKVRLRSNKSGNVKIC